MLPEQGIGRELSLGEVISKTLELYQRGFAKYFVLFAVVETIIGVLTAITRAYILLPALAPTASPADVFIWLPTFLGALFLLLGITFIVTIVFSPIAQGSSVRMASEQIEGRQGDLGESVSFAASRLLSIWALSIVTGILVILGVIAFVIPGIILAIMFSIAFPALLIEKKGVFESMGRSRELVGGRWLKTVATFLVLGIIVAIASAIVSAISAPFGLASPIVNGILSGLYQPLFPILMTVYYYSNRARLDLVRIGQTPIPPPAGGQSY